MSCRVRARGGGMIEVAIPVKGSNPTYNGSSQTLSFSNLESDYVTITGNTGTNAGSYTATATLKSDTYVWSDGTTAPKTYSWSIAKRSFTKPYFSGAISWTYNGDSHTPSVGGYNSTWMNRSGTTSATDSGTYSITYSLKDTSNTSWTDGSTANVTLTWYINQRSGLKIWFAGAYNKESEGTNWYAYSSDRDCTGVTTDYVAAGNVFGYSYGIHIGCAHPTYGDVVPYGMSVNKSQITISGRYAPWYTYKSVRGSGYALYTDKYYRTTKGTVTITWGGTNYASVWHKAKTYLA